MWLEHGSQASNQGVPVLSEGLLFGARSDISLSPTLPTPDHRPSFTLPEGRELGLKELEPASAAPQ